MEFSVVERLILLSVTPTEGSLTQLRLVRKFREELGFDDNEHKALGLRADGSTFHWDEAVEKGMGQKNIDVGAVIGNMVLKAFEQLDASSKLQMIHVDLFERFITWAAEAGTQ